MAVLTAQRCDQSAPRRRDRESQGRSACGAVVDPLIENTDDDQGVVSLMKYTIASVGVAGLDADARNPSVAGGLTRNAVITTIEAILKAV